MGIYSMVTIVNNTVLYLKVAKRISKECQKSSSQEEKKCSYVYGRMSYVVSISQNTQVSDHSALYTWNKQNVTCQLYLNLKSMDNLY